MTINCDNKGCDVASYYEDSNYCPGCKHDASGYDHTHDEYEAHCESIDARRFEEMAHGGRQDDWDEYYSMSDSISYNDAGEPRGYM